MTLFDDGGRFDPLRTGKFAEVASSVAWFVGLIATYIHPGGLVLAGILLALTASSVERAFAAGAAFGITIVAAGVGWIVVTGSLPVAISVAPSFIAFLSLVVPPGVAAAFRALG